jgi:hypothetical protein
VTEEFPDDRGPNRFAAIFLIILIGSPGSLMLFVAYTNFTPLLLIFIIPLTLAFVYSFVILAKRKQAHESKEY